MLKATIENLKNQSNLESSNSLGDISKKTSNSKVIKGILKTSNENEEIIKRGIIYINNILLNKNV